jgi:hypothetical protein
MAMKVRCEQCRKKISIDEAFAGGMCRCPYCKAVTRSGGGRRGARTVARPDRPDVPGGPAPAAVERTEEPTPVPLAKPVGIIVVLVAGAVVLFSKVKDPQPDATAGTGAENPFAASGRNVAGIEITPPVVYVVDVSSGMAGQYDAAGAIVRYSIRSLEAGDKFNVLLVREQGVEKLSDGMLPAGEGSDTKAKEFLGSRAAMGATELDPAVGQAVGLSPGTVVIIAAKGPADPTKLARQAEDAGCAIHCLRLGAEAVPETMAALASVTGGKCRAMWPDEVARWLEDLPPLP